MSTKERLSRLASEPVKVECPICRHRQWLSTRSGRCDQCGSEITLFEDRESATSTLEELSGQGRLAYLRDVADGVFAVIANRGFRAPERR